MSTVIEQLQIFGKQSWLPRIVSLLILLLFLWWAATGISSMLGNDQEIVLSETESIEQTRKVVDDESSLGQMNLFGRSKQLTTTEAENPSEKLTDLRFTLKGIFATNDPKQGAAQIQNDRQQENNFTVGQSVFGQATLDEIYPDRVILYRNGNYETLMMPGKALNEKYFTIAKQTQKVNKKPETVTSSIPQPQANSLSSKQALYKPQDNKQKATTKSKEENYRSIAISGNGNVLKDMFIFNTAWRNGKFIGFFIEAKAEKGLKLMKVLGIQNHDLITVINGLRFSEKLKSPEQLEKLKTATSIHAILERGGKEIPFHFELDAPLSNL